jgi:diphthine synthase
LAIESKCKKSLIKKSMLACVVARAGSPDPVVRAGYVKDLLSEDFGEPLHTLVIPGELHFKETEALVKLAGVPPDILDK